MIQNLTVPLLMKGKDKNQIITCHECTGGGFEYRYSSTIYLTSALAGTRGLTPSHGTATYPWGISRARFIVGWVGPRASLDGCGKSRQCRDSIPELPRPYRVPILTMLSQSTTTLNKVPQNKSDNEALGRIFRGSRCTLTNGKCEYIKPDIY